MVVRSGRRGKLMRRFTSATAIREKYVHKWTSHGFSYSCCEVGAKARARVWPLARAVLDPSSTTSYERDFTVGLLM